MFYFGYITSCELISSWTGDKSYSEPMMVKLLTYICVNQPKWANGVVYSPTEPGVARRPPVTTNVASWVMITLQCTGRPINCVHDFCCGLYGCGYIIISSWWRHQMETFSALLALCAENSPVPVNSPHKGQWRGALIFSLISVWINGWVNNREAGDLRRYRAHYDVTVMYWILVVHLPMPLST